MTVQDLLKEIRDLKLQRYNLRQAIINWMRMDENTHHDYYGTFSKILEEN